MRNKTFQLIIAGLVLGMGILWLWQHIPLKNVVDITEPADLTKLPDSELMHVKPTEVVELKDGETYNMEATIVSQKVGNRTIKRLAYNGQIPGPLIKVQKGSRVTINFTNNIDMETAVHSHGLRGDWRMDGAVPITPPVKVGETYSYNLVFPDTGVFWYHPHVREDYQQELGLYGNFAVEESGYWNEVNQEAYLMVDDILEKGTFSRDTVTHTLMGRFGDQLLINDRTDYTLTVTQGEITRVFITNVANTRTFDLVFNGALMKLVGGDSGRVEHEEIITRQIIAPAERSVLELYYNTPGTYTISHRGVTMGTVVVKPSHANASTQFSLLRTNNDYEDIRSRASDLLAKEPDKNIRLTIEMNGMGGAPHMQHGAQGEARDDTVVLMGMAMTREQAVEHCEMMPEMQGCEPYLPSSEQSSLPTEDAGIEWEDTMSAMNAMSTDETLTWIIEDMDTGAKNHDIDWSFTQGDLVKVRVSNDRNSAHPMQHPLHFHGQRFIVLATDGTPNDNYQWKDTALIPQGKIVDILVDMSNPGTWMAHCHIAEHLHSGMMFNFTVK